MPDLSYERKARRRGFKVIAGIDEAGRGPLAGPVVAGAVILPPRFRHAVLNDSKQLSEKKREAIYEEITAPDSKIIWAAGIVHAPEIDEINILQATWKAMRLAFEGLSVDADIALIDGKPIKHFPKPHDGIIKGDSKSLSIAAASIIAKVTRDRMMLDYAKQFPEYVFEKHKGYGTAIHLAALEKHGACDLHRKTFAPVRNVLERE